MLPVPNKVPPQEPEYQYKVAPGTVAVRLEEPLPQIPGGEAIGAGVETVPMDTVTEPQPTDQHPVVTLYALA